MMNPATHVWAYLRAVGLFTLALLFPLIVIGIVATFSVGVNIGRNVWRAIWAGIAAAELTLLALAAVQWKRAWVLTLNHPSRRRLAAFGVVLAAAFVAAVVVFIAVNIRDTCDC